MKVSYLPHDGWRGVSNVGNWHNPVALVTGQPVR